MNLINALKSEWLKQPRIVAGIMTGTSLDGIDVAISKFSTLENGKHNFELLAFDTYPYTTEIIDKIRKSLSKKKQNEEIAQIHFALAHLFADNIRTLSEKSNISLNDIDAIGMHGQTIWHHPEPEMIDHYKVSSTLQIGSGSALAAIINIPVVSDFRSTDIAAGGQGAPLVPIFDTEFMHDDSRDTIALNIGGIANITILPKHQSIEHILAFDTGPGNILIDEAMRFLYGKNYDKNGYNASQGEIKEKIMTHLKEMGFVHKLPPKSTGRELYDRELVEMLIGKAPLTDQKKRDFIRSFTEFTAWSIAENVIKFANPTSRIIVSGGGAKNNFLIQRLMHYLPEADIKTSDEFGINSDAKEAICFGYLAYRTLSGLSSNLPSVTGAREKKILGSVSF